MTAGGSLSGFIIRKAEKSVHSRSSRIMLSNLSIKSEPKCEVGYWSQFWLVQVLGLVLRMLILNLESGTNFTHINYAPA